MLRFVLLFSDHFVTFLDLCSNTTKSVDTTFHLRSSKTVETSKECTCSVTGGPFLVAVNDVRLTSGSGNGCSPADFLLPSSIMYVIVTAKIWAPFLKQHYLIQHQRLPFSCKPILRRFFLKWFGSPFNLNVCYFCCFVLLS